MKAQMKGISLMIILLMLVLTVQAAALRGTVTDKATKEPLIGAAVQLSGTNTGTITDVDGNFELAGLRNGTYKLIIYKEEQKKRLESRLQDPDKLWKFCS